MKDDPRAGFRKDGLMFDLRIMTDADLLAAFEIVNTMNWGYL